MKSLVLIGRILYSLPFAVFGINHFMYSGQMAGMVPAFFPGGVFWVYLTGLAMILAAVSILSRKFTSVACLLLGIMLLVFVLTVHIPGLGNPDTMQMAMVGLLKDTALAGAAFYLSGTENQSGS